MKKFNLFAIGVVAMLMAATGVYADSVTEDKDIKTATDLQRCLQAPGTANCVVTDDIAGYNLATNVVGKVTLDLGDNKVTLASPASVTVAAQAALTVTNGTLDTSTIAGNTFIVNGKGSLTLDKLTIKGHEQQETPSVVRLFGNKPIVKVTNSIFTDVTVAVGGPTNATLPTGAEVTITGTTVTGINEALTVNGFVVDKTNKITLEGNTFTTTGSNAAIYAAGYANWDIKSGTYKGNDGLMIRSGKFNITGGTFEGIGAKPSVGNVTNNSSAEALTGAAVTIASNQTGWTSTYQGGVDLTIDGGTFKAAKSAAVYEFVNSGETSTLTKLALNDGTFIGGTETNYAVAVQNTTVKNFAHGGSYTKGQMGYISAASGEPYAEGLTLGEGVNEIGVVGKEVIIKVTGIGGLNKPYTNHITTIKAVPGVKINLADLIGLDTDDTDKNNDYYRLAVKYELSNGTTGLDEFTMVDDKNVTIKLEIVEVEKDAESYETIPEPTEGTKADYSKLDAALKEAEAVEADKYTAESYAALEEAVIAAKGLSRDLTSDKQSEVDAATKALKAVLAALVEKTPDKTPSEGEPNPGTLDNVTSVAAMGGISLAIAAAGIATLKKREN